MLFLICGFVIGVLIPLAVYLRRSSAGRWVGELFDYVFASLACGVMGLVVGLFCAFLFSEMFAKYTWVETGRAELVSMRSSDRIHGSFFLASGQLDQDPQYSFYVRQADGGLKQDRRPASQSVVYEEDRKDGEMVVYGLEVDPAFRLFALARRDERYHFHVPVGSVRQEFRLE